MERFIKNWDIILFVVVMSILGVGTIFAIVMDNNAQGTMTQEQYCLWRYSNTRIVSVPAKCSKYF